MSQLTVRQITGLGAGLFHIPKGSTRTKTWGKLTRVAGSCAKMNFKRSILRSTFRYNFI
jgi:hypothetical protein